MRQRHLLALVLARLVKRRHRLGGAHLLEPENAVVGGAVAARCEKVDVAVTIQVASDELVEHAALATRDVVALPSLIAVREPGEASERIGESNVAVPVSGTAAVGADHRIGSAVGVDVGDGEAHEMIRLDVADAMLRPSCGGISRLLEPDQVEAPFDQSDVEATVGVEVEKVEVESGEQRPGGATQLRRFLFVWELRRAGDLDRMGDKGDLARGRVLEPEDAEFAPRAPDDVQVPITVEVDGLRVDRES